jgi:hypothetical protein
MCLRCHRDSNHLIATEGARVQQVKKEAQAHIDEVAGTRAVQFSKGRVVGGNNAVHC